MLAARLSREGNSINASMAIGRKWACMVSLCCRPTSRSNWAPTSRPTTTRRQRRALPSSGGKHRGACAQLQPHLHGLAANSVLGSQLGLTSPHMRRREGGIESKLGVPQGEGRRPSVSPRPRSGSRMHADALHACLQRSFPKSQLRAITPLHSEPQLAPTALVLLSNRGQVKSGSVPCWLWKLVGHDLYRVQSGSQRVACAWTNSMMNQVHRERNVNAR